MKSSTANFDNVNNDISHSPVAIVEVAGLTRKYTSGAFANISANHKKFLGDVNIRVQDLNILDTPGQSQTHIDFSVLDKDLDVTDQIKNNALQDKIATLKVGYDSLSDSDFINFENNAIKNIEDEKNLRWRFITKDISRLLNRQIFRKAPFTNLNGDHTATASTIDVDDASVLLDPANKPNYFGSLSNFIIIDSEIISYLTISVNQLQTIGHNAKNSSPDEHKDNTFVYQFYDVATYPHIALLNILLTTEDGNGHPHYDLTSFDPAWAGYGLGFDVSEVDIAEIERIGYLTYRQGSTSVFMGAYRPVSALAWLEENILIPQGWYLYKRNGKIAIGSFHNLHITTNFSAMKALNDNEIIEARAEIDNEKLVNEIQMEMNFAPATGQYLTTKNFELDESITDYGRIQAPYIIRNPWAVGNESARIKAWIARRHLETFANPPGLVNLVLRNQNILLEQGDWITITHSKLRDLIAGVRGWTAKKALILGQEISLFQERGHKIQALTWEMFNRVTSFYTITTIESGSITRTALAFNATNSSTLQAEDAYVDVTSSSADVFIPQIQVTPPGTAANKHNQLKIGFWVLDSGGTVLRFNIDLDLIRYYTNDSAPFTIQIMLLAGSTVTFDRVKLDFFDCADANGVAAASADRPTLAFNRLRHLTLNKTITET